MVIQLAFSMLWPIKASIPNAFFLCHHFEGTMNVPQDLFVQQLVGGCWRFYRPSPSAKVLPANLYPSVSLGNLHCYNWLHQISCSSKITNSPPTFLCKSCRRITNSQCPRIDPCGIPWVPDLQSYKHLSTTTLCFPLPGQFWIKISNTAQIPCALAF